MGTVTALKVATPLDPGSKPRKKGWSYRDHKPQAAPYSVGIPGYSGVRLRVLPSGRYSICTTLRVHGRRTWTTIGHICEQTPYEALLHLASEKRQDARRARKRVPVTGEAAKHTLRNVAERYIATRMANGLMRQTTADDYRMKLEIYFGPTPDGKNDKRPDVLDTPIEEIDFEAIDEARIKSHGATSRDAWHGALRVARAIVNFYSKKVLKRHSIWPVSLEIPASGANTPSPRLLEPAVVKAIIADLRANENEAARAAEFALFTGLRADSVHTHALAENLVSGILEVKTKREVIEVPLNATALRLIQGRENQLFRVTETRMRYAAQRALKAAGLTTIKRPGPHTFRKIFESVADSMLSFSETIVQDLMGRERRGLKRNYVARNPVKMREATEAVCAWLEACYEK